MVNSISFCGTIRLAPWKVAFYERGGPCLVAFLLVAHYELLLESLTGHY